MPRRRIDPPHRKPPEGETPSRPDLPLKTGVQSIMPREAWKNWAMVGLGILTWIGLLAAGVWADEVAVEWRSLLGLEAGRPIRWFGTCCLLAAAQLSFLILWHRSLSRKDFFGRYRLWYWAGLTWLGFCVAHATQLHVSAARWLAEHYELNVWNSETICWMLVAAPLTMALMRLLRREMHLCRSSSFFLRTAAGSAGVSAITTLLWPLLPHTPVTNAIAGGSTSLWHLLLASGTLMHTRFVIHVTNEVAPRMRQRKGSRIIGLLGTASLASLRMLLSIPRSLLSRIPVPRWPQRRMMEHSTSVAPEKPSKKSTATKVDVSTGEGAAAASGRRLGFGNPLRMFGVFGGMRGRWANWKAARAERREERATMKALLREERSRVSAAKAEEKRLAREASATAAAEASAAREAAKAEREAIQARAKADRDAADLKAKAEKQAAQARQAAERAATEEKARLAREAAQREKAATEAKAKADREAAQREQAAAEARIKTAQEATRKQQEAAQAAARKAEQLAAVNQAVQSVPKAAPAKPSGPAPHFTPPKSGKDQGRDGGAIKPQHVSFDEREYDPETDDDATLSRKDRKKLKKRNRQQQYGDE